MWRSPVTERVHVVVVGGGPAGLATSQQLRQHGVPHRVLERGDTVGYTWANLYESLTLHTGKHMSSLPGMAFPRSAPLFVSRQDFLEYLRSYAARFELAIETGCEVHRITPTDGTWTVSTNRGVLAADCVVVATGIVANPKAPHFPGQEQFAGRLAHSVAYRRPDGYVGRRVLVVGVGNSGAEIGSEIARAGGEVTVAVRSGANVVPLTLAECRSSMCPSGCASCRDGCRSGRSRWYASSRSCGEENRCCPAPRTARWTRSRSSGSTWWTPSRKA